ncbi:PadR family transcriptional regulator (plasmid) [Haloferax mediterranei ATCC 33500]|uniref:Transcriptional regulator n=1 Tax=Haloferax mediterranei (strain ATCC 33500 / DSM 1411 / JCM 8866 / NBRC 14739 / NCIMB 2177 / R-4) TaxID=523841 RepID=I3RAJ0_HALMT|nr:helix-turn-helix transcriptional regulator [Haloferax mediterranei]AFK21250.1 transcription regulator [Haloferax mediterranei ATCC 33500]AHZ24649.1 transcriptional regulator [Haloferax mediterranei ATCC 33500]ELZ97420.1 transcriptional regulator [Haloferax mediterranei ATCC 33500]MDX5990285.1 helix-turn-helix transcriptional regulator [Haloferax mediterranei ATCC 33500]QCQ77044.1 PadR family transcriptional regulator [Haloferax mediterranei ATCC 33500]
MDVHELTAIQRDLLFVISGMSGSSGQAIKSELRETQGRNLLAGRVYSNLDELVEQGLVDKGSKNGRTNEYVLTEKGEKAIRNRRRWERRYVKQTV